MSAGPVEAMVLGSVKLPAGHPRAAEGVCTIQGFVVRHPDGLLLVDTGVAGDHELLNQLYEPTVVPIVEALNASGVDERDVVAIINTHLHFDHCGQNRFLPAVPVYVQAAELRMVDLPRFTIPEWARINEDRQRVIDGDQQIAPGVTLMATPGHTPGHQSVVIDLDDRRLIIVGQCCYTCDEFELGQPLSADMHDDTMLETGIESLQRLRRLYPNDAYFSHDRTVYRPRGRSSSGPSEP